jgi:hypothetical protein
VTIGGKSVKEFPPEVIWHIRGPSWSGDIGLEAVYHAREAIGLALATEETHATLHKNGVRPTGVYSVEGVLNRTQYDDLAKWLKSQFSGDNAGAPMILDRNAKWLSQAITGVDAQHLETRRMQIEEICRALRVMPIMVGHSDKARRTPARSRCSSRTSCIRSRRGTSASSSRSTCTCCRRRTLEAAFTRSSSKRDSCAARFSDRRVPVEAEGRGVHHDNEGREKLDMNPDKDPESDKIQQPANVTGKQPDAGGASAPGNTGA